MRILVLSNTPWSNENSFGNSFSNIFGGMDGIEIANIYCRYGEPNNDIVKKHFQITEKSLLKNLKDHRYPSGKEIIEIKQTDILDTSERKLFDHARKRRLQIFFWIRNIIWKIGRWDSLELKKFINDFNPDIIFQPIYYSTYINDISLFIKKFTNVPMVGYVSDDVYSLRQFSLSPLYWIDRFIVRSKVKRVISNCEHLYVISEIQKREYEKCFKKDCKILTKGADFKSFPVLKEENNKPLKLVYTGNIGDGRWKTLGLIGKALKSLNTMDNKAQLYIYTMTPLTNKMHKSLSIEGSIFLMGGVPSSQVESIQKNADILVHVESFGLKERLQAHQSFSTKIVDYFYRKRCIFAVGPSDVASIDYLEKNDAALVSKDEVTIIKQLEQLIKDPLVITEYAEKAWNCGKKNHQINKIQEKLYEELNSLVNPVNAK